MSALSQFGGQSLPLGSYALFSANAANSLTLSDGRVFLKSGVLAKASDYPTVPADFQYNLNPLAPVSEFGSGGCWSAIVIDPATGLPLIVSDHAQGGLVMMSSATPARDSDVTLQSGYGAYNMAGGGYPGVRHRKAIAHKGAIVVANNWTLANSSYAFYAWGYSSTPAGGWNLQGYSNPGLEAGPTAFASNPNGNLIALWPGSSNGVLYAATAGTTATVGTMPATATWTAATWNATNALFIAVASGGTQAASSTDGVTWTSRTLPASASWSAVAAGTGARSVAVASGGTSAAYSDNGTTWTTATLPASVSWSAVAHNGSLWVAVASGGNVAASSSDGITWTQRTLPASAGWCDVKWCATLNVWVAIASDGKAAAAYSADGITWTAKQLPWLINFATLFGTGSTLYALEALGPISYASDFTVAKSTDSGATWTYYKPNTRLGLNGDGPQSNIRLVNGGLTGLWRVSATQIGIGRSTDGISWTVTTPTLGSDHNYWEDIAWNGTVYVIASRIYNGGQHPYLYTSTDLTTWTQRTAFSFGGVNYNPFNVIAVGTNLLAMARDDTNGNSIQIARSTDNGATWTQVYTNAGPSSYTYSNSGGLKYDPDNGVVTIFNYQNSGVVASLDGGVTWVAPSTYHAGGQEIATIAPGGGSTWASVNYLTMNVVSNKYGSPNTSQYLRSYSHGYTLKQNAGKNLTYGAVPHSVILSGVSYYTDGQRLLKLDTSMYVDNTRIAGEANGSVSTAVTLYYYMRVK